MSINYSIFFKIFSSSVRIRFLLGLVLLAFVKWKTYNFFILHILYIRFQILCGIHIEIIYIFPPSDKFQKFSYTLFYSLIYRNDLYIKNSFIQIIFLWFNITTFSPVAPFFWSPRYSKIHLFRPSQHYAEIIYLWLVHCNENRNRKALPQLESFPSQSRLFFLGILLN